MVKQLLKFEGKRLVLVEEGLKIIEKVEGPFGVLCIVGPKSSGRSFLLELIIERRDIFMDQIAIPESTAGARVYEEVQEVGNLKVVVIDVQGLDGSEADSQLLSAIYLITSSFIFNSKGAIDESAILFMQPLTKLSSIMQFTSGNATLETLAPLSPRFLWVLRDFQLTLADEDGNVISSRDYMENVLNVQHYKSKRSEDCIAIKDAFVKLFPERDCIICPRPVDSAIETVHLNSRELKPKFLSQVEKVKSKSFLSCPPKKMFGQLLNGKLLCKMLKIFIDNSNTGRVFNIQRTWKQVLADEYSTMFEELKLLYESLKEFNARQMPYEEHELISKLNQAKIKALLFLRTAFIKDREQIDRLTEDFEAYYATDYRFTLEENLASSMDFNMAVLDQAFKEIFSKIDTNTYSTQLEALEADWTEASMQFEEKSRGPGKLAALKEFSEKYQHQRFSKFFRDMVFTFERKLDEAVRESAHSKEQRLRAEEEARLLATSEENIGAMIRDMEQKIGIKTPEGAPLHEVMRSILTWLRTKQEERSRYERDIKKLEDELEAIEVQLSSKKKSCCLVF
mmetsp:Transcript_29045/g.51968  ORF Transcript_29045/g.51968 Transcript_29045/m.51968 type:complete len:567 (-) Transcript_29045:14-1714(-)